MYCTLVWITFSGMNNGSYQGNNNDGRRISADAETILDRLSRAINIYGGGML